MENIETNVTTTAETAVNSQTENEGGSSSALQAMRQMASMLKTAKSMIEIMEATWISTRDEFAITENQIARVIEFNNEHRDPKPEEPEKDANGNEIEYDEFNGLRHLTMENVIEIFGADSPIIGMDLTHTIDRVRSAAGAFYSLYDAYRNYNTYNGELTKLIEEYEEENIRELRRIATEDPDPAKREKATRAVEDHDTIRLLRFLPGVKNPAKPEQIQKLRDAFNDEGRIQYTLERCREYLKTLRIPEKFILEVSSFEKRFLPEEYWDRNNMLLLYFMSTVVFEKATANEEVGKRVRSFVVMMDRLVRNDLPEDVRTEILANIRTFEDLFQGMFEKKDSDERSE